MTEPIAFLNGRWILYSELVIPVWDAGFVQGVTVAEQLRTFRGNLFRLDLHLERLKNSIRIVGVDLGSEIPLREQALELVQNNYPLLPSGHDLGLSIFVTPGPYAAFAPPEARGPTVGLHTYPVFFKSFAGKYETGERLATTKIMQVPTNCWPAALKCRSRMHYYLADQHARQMDPSARALMLDQDGFVTEASTANLILYRRGIGFLSPPLEKILPGISVGTLELLARDAGVGFHYQDLTVADVLNADEAFLCSTSPCLLPVVALNHRSIGDGKPGPLFRQFIQAWNDLVGMDIVRQAQEMARM